MRGAGLARELRGARASVAWTLPWPERRARRARRHSRACRCTMPPQRSCATARAPWRGAPALFFVRRGRRCRTRARDRREAVGKRGHRKEKTRGKPRAMCSPQDGGARCFRRDLAPRSCLRAIDRNADGPGAPARRRLPSSCIAAPSRARSPAARSRSSAPSSPRSGRSCRPWRNPGSPAARARRARPASTEGPLQAINAAGRPGRRRGRRDRWRARAPPGCRSPGR